MSTAGPLLHCGNCGAGLPGDGRFCGDCGAPALAPPTLAVADPSATAVRPTAATAPRPVGLPLRAILPRGTSWRDGAWRRGQASLFVAIAVAPFVLLQISSDDRTVEGAAIGFAVYFAVLWLLGIRVLVRPEPLGWLVPVGIAGFTAVAGIALAVAIEEQLGASTGTILESTLTVGIPEEFAKALPVLLLLRRGRWSPRTYLYAGVLSGLAFGAAEAVTYTVAYASVLDLGDGGLVVSLWRLLCGSLFHACMAGIVAFFIGLATWYPSVRWHLAGFGLLVAGVLHGLYNYFSDGWGGVLIAAATVLAFVDYLRSEDRIGRDLSGRLG